MKRSIRIDFNDGSESIDLELSKATSINTKRKVIEIEQLNDGTWRLIYNENLIPDFSKLEKLVIIRE